MATSKINPHIKANPDTGYATQARNIFNRFLNRDGSFNRRKTGRPFWKRMSLYSYLLEISWSKFLAISVLFYFLVNVLFTSLYLLVGIDQLQGFITESKWGRIKETFFFSTQTFTTVGYGRINPAGDGADIVTALETMCGWFFFALVTGILYGRITRPRAYIAFSENLLVSPYKGGLGLMFRMAPYNNIHQITDANVSANLSLLVKEHEKANYQFFQLFLEHSHIAIFNMNWTVVHPINQDSPLHRFTKEDFENADFELVVQVTGFDPIYSNQVMQRTSYTMEELVWGAKFSLMYHQSRKGHTTMMELDKLNQFESVSLPDENL